MHRIHRHGTNWIVTAAVMVVIVITQGGCSARLESLLDPLGRQRGGDAVEWNIALAQHLNRPSSQLAQRRDEYASETDPSRRRSLRDEMAMGVLALIDEHHERSRIAFASVRAGHDAAADLAVIGLTTAATLAGGEAIKSVLAATASAVTGANAAINDRFLREQSTGVILAQMDVDHALALAAVLDNLRTHDDAEYPLAAAQLDLLECLHAGTPVRALASLADQASLRRASILRHDGNGRERQVPPE